MKLFTNILIILRLTTYAFVPNILLNGPVGGKITSYSVPKSISYKYIKKYEIEEIKKDSPMYICRELSETREKLRSNNTKNEHVTFFMDNETNKHLFTIIYRMNEKLPTVYTVESIVKTPDITFRTNDIRIIIEQMCNDRKGFLQIRDISRKYKAELYLENQLDL